MSSYTIDQLTIAMNAPVVHPTEPRRSKQIALQRFALAKELGDELRVQKVELKVKSPSYKASEHTKRRFTTDSKEEVKGCNGKVVRIAINKKTRKVNMVNESNWTEEAILLFKEKFAAGFAPPSPKRGPKINKVAKAAKAIVKQQLIESKAKAKAAKVEAKAAKAIVKQQLIVSKAEAKVAKAAKALEKEMLRRSKFDSKLVSK